MGGSASGGKSSSKSSGSQTSEAATQMQKMASQLMNEQGHLRRSFAGSLTGLLKGQGATPYNKLDPSAAISQSRLAQGRALQNTKEQLVKSRLMGTPEGENIMAQARMMGQHQTSQIAPTFANESANRQQQMFQTILSIIPQFIGGTQGAVASGLGAAVGGNVNAKGKSGGTNAGMSLPFL